MIASEAAERKRPALMPSGLSPAAGVWIALGTFLILLQLYVFASWILSDDFRATAVGLDPVPTRAVLGVRIYEVLSLVSLAVLIPWFIAGIRRAGRIDHLRATMLGFLATYWSDPWLNFLRPMFTYNAYAFNRGCWCEFIPFWQSGNGARIAEPLLIDGPAYFYSFAGTAWIALAAMRWARRRRPTIGAAALCLVAFASIWLTMGVLDIFATRVLHFDAWPGAFHAASFWGGAFYQFPIYEFLAFPSIFVVCAFVVLGADGNGEVAIERGIGGARNPWLRGALRVLAFVGLCNTLNLAYTTALGVHAMRADPWPAMPSWLANEQCGGITGRACPASGR